LCWAFYFSFSGRKFLGSDRGGTQSEEYELKMALSEVKNGCVEVLKSSVDEF
jgi:hypothetical protein